MNDYTIGAMEALSWAYAILERCKELKDFIEARNEVRDMIMRLSTGAAVSFKRKTEFIKGL
jgi:hypothetical protein